MPDTVQRCTACGYIMSETLLNVCVRCGQQTAPYPVNELINYHRRYCTIGYEHRCV